MKSPILCLLASALIFLSLAFVSARAPGPAPKPLVCTDYEYYDYGYECQDLCNQADAINCYPEQKLGCWCNLTIACRNNGPAGRCGARK